MNISVCGIDCEVCSFKKEGKCSSCRIAAANGQCVWGGRCETHDCAINQGYSHCGECASFPCQRLLDIHKSENPDGNGVEIENLRSLIRKNESKKSN